MASTRPNITVKPAPHGANAVASSRHSITTPKELLKSSCYQEFQKIRNDHLIQSSFDDTPVGIQYLGASNGFVDTAIIAYNQHHHLIIRPEDVWFSLLVQLNVYINAHAEELRSIFVAHAGQKRLQLEVSSVIAGKALMGVDWAKFSYQIGKKIEENIIDPSLREWFLPAFTTTTKSDQATASIIMMSAMQKYFSYGCSIACGLPSVTLLGTKGDWQKMLSRLERLKTFGEESTLWYGLLKPVFTKFVETFDDPESVQIKDFWQRIAHYSGGGSGPSYLSGWITAFCFWDAQGKCFHIPGQNPSSEEMMYSMGAPTPVLSLDGARYHRSIWSPFIKFEDICDYCTKGTFERICASYTKAPLKRNIVANSVGGPQKIETSAVPAGWTSVPVELDNNGEMINAAMVAGSVGMRILSSGTELESGETGIDTVQPVSGWWMYETMSEEEILEEKKKQYEQMREKCKWMPEWKGKESPSWLGH